MSVVLKVGGSLLEHAPRLLNYLDRQRVSALVVPGGGVFADLVRRVARRNRVSDEAAHWMAIYAMSQYAHYLHDKTGIPLTPRLKQPTGMQILLPHDVLRSDEELERSWDTTSDTIAAWTARRLDARLIKATDVDGVLKNGRPAREISAAEIRRMGETCVDKGLPDYLTKHEMDCVVVNGLHPERVLKTIRGEPGKYTIIRGD